MIEHIHMTCSEVVVVWRDWIHQHRFAQLATEKIIYIRQTITSILAVQYSISLSFKQLCIRNVEK